MLVLTPYSASLVVTLHLVDGLCQILPFLLSGESLLICVASVVLLMLLYLQE